MAILGTAKCSESGCTEAQAQRRMQQLHEAAEHMRQVADATQLQYGEASHEYRAALDQWNAALQYFEQFINELVAASEPFTSKSPTVCEAASSRAATTSAAQSSSPR